MLKKTVRPDLKNIGMHCPNNKKHAFDEKKRQNNRHPVFFAYLCKIKHSIYFFIIPNFENI